MLENIVRRFLYKPRYIFAIDGLGALLSAFLLGVVLVNFQALFGIPIPMLYFLASIPIIFAIYDLYCFRKPLGQMAPLIKGIAIMNILYCILSAGAAIKHYGTLTIFGNLYILT